MRLISILILFCVATTATADPFPKGDALAGQQLFVKYDCNQCHNQIMKGDGNKIFTRINRKRNSPEGLIEQIGMCSSNVNAHFTPQQVQNLAAYLNQYYKFK